MENKEGEKYNSFNNFNVEEEEAEKTPLLNKNQLTNDPPFFLCLNKTKLIFLLLISNLLLICLFILFILLIILAYFIYPRVPSTEINNTQAKNYSLSPQPPSIFLFFTFDVVVDNENYYDVDITEVLMDLSYRGAKMGNFSLQFGNVTRLSARTPDLKIPMSGSVNSATIETIGELITQSTANGYNNFHLNGTLSLTTKFLPTEISVEVQTDIFFSPSLLPSSLFNNTLINNSSSIILL